MELEMRVYRTGVMEVEDEFPYTSTVINENGNEDGNGNLVGSILF